MHFQLLTGIKFTIRPRIHGPIYLSIIFVISAITFVITNIKKMKERYKEWKFHQNINVNLNTQLPYEGKLQFNNSKNNFPLLSGFQITLLVGFVLTCHMTFWFLSYTFNNSNYYYKQYYILRELALVIYNIAIPLIFMIKNKKIRKYFWQYITRTHIVTPL